VQILAIESIPSAEPLNLMLNAPLLGLESRKVDLALRERAQVIGHERAHGAALLRGSALRRTVDIVGN